MDLSFFLQFSNIKENILLKEYKLHVCKENCSNPSNENITQHFKYNNKSDMQIHV